MKNIIIILTLIICSCTSSRDRYWDLTQKPNTKWCSNEELSNIIQEAYPFIHTRNIHGRKGWIYLSGYNEGFYVELDVGDGEIVVSDNYDTKERKFQSEQGGELREFLKELVQVLKQSDIEVDVGERHYTVGIYID